MAAEDLVPKVKDVGEQMFSDAKTRDMICDEDNVRKGRFVTFTDGENYPPKGHECDAGDPADGVALMDGSDGEKIRIIIEGEVKMYAGAAVTTSDLVKSDGEGRAVPVAATNVKMAGGKAMMKAGEADDEFIVFVSPVAQNQVIA